MGRMLEAPLDSERIQHIYDRIGRRYDLMRFAEEEPKKWSIEALDLRPGERALEIGPGPGLNLIALAQRVRATSPVDASPTETLLGRSQVVGVDISPVMRDIAWERARAANLAQVIELRPGDARNLPCADGMYDAALCCYVLDLLPTNDILTALREIKRILRPGGRAALVALAPGANLGLGARIFTTAYETLYRLRPALLGGCRPIALEPLTWDAGFNLRARRAWFKGHPSEALLVEKPIG